MKITRPNTGGFNIKDEALKLSPLFYIGFFILGLVGTLLMAEFILW